MQVSNSLIAGNALSSSGATAVRVDYSIDADSAAIVNNNTIANNSGGAGLTIISADGSYRLGEATNNIVYGHTIDLNLAGFFYPDNSLSVRNNLYGTLLGIAALAGGGVAVRQSWIQWFPPQVSECGPGLEYMLESFPLSSSLPMIFRGAGDCSTIDWTFLGLSIANWSFLSFATILVSLVLYLAGQKR